MKELVLRIVFGILGVVLFLLAVVAGGWIFLSVIVILAFLGLLEYFQLLRRKGRKPYRFITVLASMIFILLSSKLEFAKLSVIAFIALFLIFILSIPYYYTKGRTFDDGALSLYGFLYVSIPSALMIMLRSIGLEHVLFVLGTTWINDTFAYFTGKFLGKHKLASKISPKKTWEGFLGGFVFALLFAYVFSKIVGMDTSFALFCAFVLCITGTLGDIAESVLKREAGVKDSGVFLPGHGGILDRVDSLLVNIPMYFILLSIAGGSVV